MASEDVKANTSLECRENCVFCQSDGESGAASQLKILKCLHVSCKSCAEQFLRYDNTICCARCQIVTPDPGPGRKLTECLVSWPTQQSAACADSDADEQDESSPGYRVHATDKFEPALYCQDSDCEDMNEPAKMRCTTCDLSLCRQHSALHTRSRKRANHSMAAVPPAKRRMRQRDNMEICPLHNEDLRSYCTSCNVLICTRCNTSKQPADRCKHDLVDVKDAVKGLRAAEAVLQNEIPDLENRLAAVETRIDTINRETEEISEKIKGDYSAALKIFEDYSEKQLVDLDEERWRVIKTLEKLKEARQEELRTRKTGGYLSRTLSDGEVLQALSHRQMSTGMSKTDGGTSGNEDCDGDNQKAKDEDPETGGCLGWTLSDGAVLQALSHRQMSTGTSKTDGGTSGNEECDGDNQKAKDEDPENCVLKVNFTPVISSCAKTLVWMLQDPIGANLRPHPNFKAQLSFNVNQPSKHISLNDDKSMATCTQPNSPRGWSTAFALCPPIPFGVRVRSGRDVLIGFTSIAAPHKDFIGWLFEGVRFYGWAGSQSHPRSHTVGGTLGQPWAKDDVIRLTLDTKDRKATAVHTRTGISETISIDEDQFPVCFIAALGQKESVRFLSPAIRL